MAWVRGNANERESREDRDAGDVADEVEWMVDTATHRIFSRPRRAVGGDVAPSGSPVLLDGSMKTRR